MIVTSVGLLNLGRKLLHSPDVTEDEILLPVFIGVSVLLVVMAGLMSGLTLGLMSLDTVELEVLKRSGTPTEKKYVDRIMPVVKQQHYLLVTLVLCNAAATEALPIFLDRLANPITAVILSVTVVLVFGEILPQSICSRYGLQVGAYSAWFVRLLMILTAPISWPIAKVLDWVLGPDHSALFRRAQLKTLVDLHGEQEGLGGTLTEDEIHVIRGALDLTNKTAMKSMTPLDKVFMLSTEDRLDEKTLQTILKSGHSRIPVYRGDNRFDIVGIILVKELILVNPPDCVLVGDLQLRPLPKLSADTLMYDMLRLFETGRSHMAVLTKPTQPLTVQGTQPASDGFLMPFPHPEANMLDDVEGEAIGIITIEDVIEELLQEEIVDETDQFVDNMQTARVNAAVLNSTLPPRLKTLLTSGAFTPRVGRLAGLRRADNGTMVLDSSYTVELSNYIGPGKENQMLFDSNQVRPKPEPGCTIKEDVNAPLLQNKQ